MGKPSSEREPLEIVAVRHLHPAWGDRADAEAAAELEHFVEFFPVERRPDGLYVLCAIPLLVYGYSLGDVVEVAEGRLGRVVAHGGFTYRVMLDDRADDARTPAENDAMLRRALDLDGVLRAMGMLVEWHGLSYGAIAALDRAGMSALVRRLRKLELAGELTYESAE